MFRDATGFMGHINAGEPLTPSINWPDREKVVEATREIDAARQKLTRLDDEVNGVIGGRQGPRSTIRRWPR